MGKVSYLDADLVVLTTGTWIVLLFFFLLLELLGAGDCWVSFPLLEPLLLLVVGCDPLFSTSSSSPALLFGAGTFVVGPKLNSFPPFFGPQELVEGISTLNLLDDVGVSAFNCLPENQ